MAIAQPEPINKGGRGNKTLKVTLILCGTGFTPSGAGSASCSTSEQLGTRGVGPAQPAVADVHASWKGLVIELAPCVHRPVQGLHLTRDAS